MPRTRAKKNLGTPRPKAKAKATPKRVVVIDERRRSPRGHLESERLDKEREGVEIVEKSDSEKSQDEDLQKKLEEKESLIEDLQKQMQAILGEQKEVITSNDFETPLGRIMGSGSIIPIPTAPASIMGDLADTRIITVAKMEKYEFSHFDNKQGGMSSKDWIKKTMGELQSMTDISIVRRFNKLVKYLHGKPLVWFNNNCSKFETLEQFEAAFSFRWIQESAVARAVLYDIVQKKKETVDDLADRVIAVARSYGIEPGEKDDDVCRNAFVNAIFAIPLRQHVIMNMVGLNWDDMVTVGRKAEISTNNLKHKTIGEIDGEKKREKKSDGRSRSPSTRRRSRSSDDDEDSSESSNKGSYEGRKRRKKKKPSSPRQEEKVVASVQQTEKAKENGDGTPRRYGGGNGGRKGKGFRGGENQGGNQTSRPKNSIPGSYYDATGAKVYPKKAPGQGPNRAQANSATIAINGGPTMTAGITNATAVGVTPLFSIHEARKATEVLVKLGKALLPCPALCDTGAWQSTIASTILKTLRKMNEALQITELTTPVGFEIAGDTGNGHTIYSVQTVKLDVFVECKGKFLKIPEVQFYVINDKRPTLLLGIPILLKFGINPVQPIKDACELHGTEIPSQPFGSGNDLVAQLMALCLDETPTSTEEDAIPPVPIMMMRPRKEFLPSDELLTEPSEWLDLAIYGLGEETEAEWSDREDTGSLTTYQEVPSIEWLEGETMQQQLQLLLARNSLEDGDDLDQRFTNCLDVDSLEEIVKQLHLRVDDAAKKSGRDLDSPFVKCFRELVMVNADAFRISTQPTDKPARVSPMEAPLRPNAIPKKQRLRRSGKFNAQIVDTYLGSECESGKMRRNDTAIWASPTVVVVKPDIPPIILEPSLALARIKETVNEPQVFVSWPDSDLTRDT
eukprot:GHVU01104720.1.p1 GENE.GHVU01104720.1~~GHVU01104720.1.p1  ORF type:complete len:907 (+),score=144.58 GHVU01104720.1:185-2905(+)